VFSVKHLKYQRYKTQNEVSSSFAVGYTGTSAVR